MNYLAHAFFSFSHPEVLVGNMISDFVKGKSQYDYPLLVQKGIKLHRLIDEFTDNHPATKEGKLIFSPVVRLYSGAFMDVVYDHFLAKDENLFSPESLMKFSLGVYKSLALYEGALPPGFKNVFPYMKQYNWLYNYMHLDGINQSFNGLSRRAVYLSSSVEAYEAFLGNYEKLADCYYHFIEDVKSFAWTRFQQLIME